MKDKGLECNGTKQTKRQIHHNVVLLEVKGIEGTCHWFISLPLNYNWMKDDQWDVRSESHDWFIFHHFLSSNHNIKD